MGNVPSTLTLCGGELDAATGLGCCALIVVVVVVVAVCSADVSGLTETVIGAM